MTKKRKFYDAYVPLKITQNLEKQVEELSKNCLDAGYRGCVFTIRVGSTYHVRSKVIHRAYRYIRGLSAPETYAFRIEIEAKNQHEALRYIRKYRRMADLLSIIGYNRSLLSLGSRDRRVDIITLIPGISPKIFRGDLKYVLSLNKFYEFQLQNILVKNDPIKTAKMIAFTKFLIKPIVKKNVNLLFSTGFSSAYTPRDPRNIVSFAKIFFDLPEDYIVLNMSEKILNKIIYNRLKIKGKIPLEGVIIEKN